MPPDFDISPGQIGTIGTLISEEVFGTYGFSFIREGGGTVRHADFADSGALMKDGHVTLAEGRGRVPGAGGSGGCRIWGDAGHQHATDPAAGGRGGRGGGIGSLPDLAVERLRHKYIRVEERVYRYESDGGTFTAELEVDDRGIVTRYADIWRAGPHVRKGLSVDEENRHCLDGDPRRATDVWTAFASAEAMESWLPPDGMSARMLTFDFRDGGSYRVRLTYDEAADAPGKTSVDADEVEVRLVRVVPNETIEQAATFESEDSAFVGVMPSNETCPQESVSRITLNYRSCLATE